MKGHAFAKGKTRKGKKDKEEINEWRALKEGQKKGTNKQELLFLIGFFDPALPNWCLSCPRGCPFGRIVVITSLFLNQLNQLLR